MSLSQTEIAKKEGKKFCRTFTQPIDRLNRVSVKGDLSKGSQFDFASNLFSTYYIGFAHFFLFVFLP